jgi:hypothetical protein
MQSLDVFIIRRAVFAFKKHLKADAEINST